MPTTFPRTPLYALLRVAAIAVPIAILACDSDSGPNAPPSATGAGLTIVPAIIEIIPGATKALQVFVQDESGSVVPSPVVQWKTANSPVATVTATGTVTAIAVGNASIIATSGGLSDTATVRVIPPAASGAFIDIFPEVTYQQMTGWEATASMGEVECNQTAFAIYKQEVVARSVNELGINRVRLEIGSGIENPQDYYTPYRTAVNPSDFYRYRYQSINDNDDPLIARPGGFQFSSLDHKEEVILRPLRTLLAARGERLYVNLNYVDFGDAAWEHSSNPEEYAELIHATFVYLRDRYGWVPDAVEIILEPDNTGNWTPEVIAKALVAAGDRLRASGFRPAFIAPSNTNMSRALAYFDQMLAVPRVLEYLTDIAYHRYGGVSDATLAAIASRANQYGLRTAMLENIGSDYHDLHADLRDGRNSAWQQFTLAYCDPDNGAHHYNVDQSVPSSPRLTLGSLSRYFRQYFTFIRFGAVRVGATSGNSQLDPLAFRNTNGQLVVVVKATAGTTTQVRRLPPGLYGLTYTTADQSFVSLANVTVTSTRTLTLPVPAAGVITLYAR